jgi:hypothetical protein
MAVTVAQAQTGPGIPRVTFASNEIGTRIHIWTNLVGRVPNVLMFQGYLLIFQHRARKVSAFDLSDPRQPKLFSESYGHGGQGDEHVVPAVGTRLLLAGTLVDYANPLAPQNLGRAPLYLSVWPTLQWPYLYNTRTYDTDGKSSPLAVYDWSASGTPRLVKSIDAVSQVGFTTGTAIALGNLLLVSSGDVYTGVAVYDISNPVEPVLLSVNKTGPAMYTGQHYGKYIVTTGPKTQGRVGFFDISDPENIRLEFEQNIPNMRDYAHFQNGYLFGSAPGTFIKYDIAARKTVLTGTVPASPNGAPRPFRYCIPLGNMLFLGDPDDGGAGVGDGRTGNAVGALFVHQARPDSIGPSLLFFDPPDGAVRVPVTARVGLAFDENLDNRRIHHVEVRTEGGIPVPGEYGHTMGILNFTPRDRLLANTVYEVTVPRDSIKDWTGNGNAQEYSFRFSTGATLNARGTPPGRAGWWDRPRLAARPLDGGRWRITLIGWKGALPGGLFRVSILDASGRKAGEFSARPAELQRGVEWAPGRHAGPLWMRIRLPGGEARGYLAPGLR